MKKLLIFTIGMALGTALHAARMKPSPNALKEKVNLLLKQPIDDSTLGKWQEIASEMKKANYQKDEKLVVDHVIQVLKGDIKVVPGVTYGGTVMIYDYEEALADYMKKEGT